MKLYPTGTVTDAEGIVLVPFLACATARPGMLKEVIHNEIKCPLPKSPLRTISIVDKTSSTQDECPNSGWAMLDLCTCHGVISVVILAAVSSLLASKNHSPHSPR